MNKKLKISIVVPVYNLQDCIERCVKSILAQTYTNLEILIVDDGSTDNSRQVIEKLAESDSRIVSIFKDNGGVTSARLTGVEKASGEWIGFVDGDDEIEPDMYRLLLDNGIKYGADISHCGYQMIFSDGRIHYFYNTGCLVKQDRTKGLKDLLDGSLVEPGVCNKIFRRNLFNKLLDSEMMNTDIKINEDLLLNYYLFSEVNSSIFEDVCKYHYIVRKNSASRAKLNEHKIFDPIRVRQTILEDCLDEIKFDAEKALVNTCVYTFCSLITSGEALESEKRYIRSVIKKHYDCAFALSKRTRLLTFFIAKMPICVTVLYPIYSKWFQKKKYE